jgi:hypothetical protein
MTTYSKLNVIYRLQKWMDSVPGQTFLNYAYSWGASIVILGTLFKLTHMDGADFFLFLGMGTEVLVFFLSAFDRPFDKTTDGMELDTHVRTGEDSLVTSKCGSATVVGGVVGGGSAGASGPVVIGGGATGGGGTVIIGGGNVPAGDGENSVAVAEGGASISGPIVIGGGGSAVGGGPAVVSGNGPAVVTPSAPHPELDAATAGYVEELKHLTETLAKVSAQNEKLAHDSEEMENLNRTLTGICKVYEMQLKSASSQIGTIDDINEQTKKMAEQIQELNRIYTRMIEALQVRASVTQ